MIFNNEQFDGVWSVQALQHIPNFELPVKEIFRVLKPEGYFSNYSWNNVFWVRVIYQLFRKKYHVKGHVPNRFWLARASEEQEKIIQTIFNNKISIRYSEILFTPNLRFFAPAVENSFLGFIDSYLSNNLGFFSSIAGQCSYHVKKLNSSK